MRSQLADFASKVLSCLNSDEVNSLVDNDESVVIIRQFDCEFVFIKYVEDEKSRQIVPIYVNFADSTYQIDDFIKQDRYNQFIKLEKLDNGNVHVQYDNLEAEINIIFNYPKGESYQIVVENGASGTGSGWGKNGLNLD
jgi:hypothetical protein